MSQLARVLRQYRDRPPGESDAPGVGAGFGLVQSIALDPLVVALPDRDIVIARPGAGVCSWRSRIRDIVEVCEGDAVAIRAVMVRDGWRLGDDRLGDPAWMWPCGCRSWHDAVLEAPELRAVAPYECIEAAQ